MISHLVLLNSLFQTLVALRIHVVCPNEHAQFSGGDGKGPDSSHDVAHHLAWDELFDKPSVFCLEFTVPVDFGVVKLECAVVLGDSNI